MNETGTIKITKLQAEEAIIRSDYPLEARGENRLIMKGGYFVEANMAFPDPITCQISGIRHIRYMCEADNIVKLGRKLKNLDRQKKRSAVDF